ncbi:hypothetical protein MTR67_010935, partial [Solanum verrucosum]
KKKSTPLSFGSSYFVTEILSIRGYFESEWWWSSSRSDSSSSRCPEPGNLLTLSSVFYF